MLGYGKALPEGQQPTVVAAAGDAEQADQPVAVGVVKKVAPATPQALVSVHTRAVVAEGRFGGQTLTLGQHPPILSRASIPQLIARPLDGDGCNTWRDR